MIHIYVYIFSALNRKFWNCHLKILHQRVSELFTTVSNLRRFGMIPILTFFSKLNFSRFELMSFWSILFKFGEMTAVNEPYMRSKSHVQILSRFGDVNNWLLFSSLNVAVKQSSKLEHFVRPHQGYHLKDSELQTISHHLKPFLRYSRSKIEKLSDIVGYKTRVYWFTYAKFDGSVSHYYPQPLSKF